MRCPLSLLLVLCLSVACDQGQVSSTRAEEPSSACKGDTKCATVLDLRVSALTTEQLHASLRASDMPKLEELRLPSHGLTEETLRELLASPLLPGLRTLDLGYAKIGPEGVKALADTAALSGLEHLVLDFNGLGDEGVQAILASPHLTRLESLHLRGNGLSRRSVEALAGSPNVKNLETLSLAENRLGSVEALATSLHLGRLRALNLSRTMLRSRDLGALARAKTLEGLTWLDISHNDLGGTYVSKIVVDKEAKLARARLENAGALGALSHLTRLETLRVGHNPIGDEGVVALMDARLKNLEVLDLGSTDHGMRGIEALASSSDLSTLRSLNLRYGSIGERGARALASAAWMSGLRDLDVGHSGLGNAGVEALLGSPNLGELESLNLDGNWIDVVGVKALAGAPKLGNLRSLHLSQNRLGSAGVQALVWLAHIKQVQTLDLSKNRIGDSGLEQLASPNLARLRHLYVQDNGITEAGFQAWSSNATLGELRTLDVSGNRIGPEGAKALDAPGFGGLQALNLEGNAIGDEGVQALTGSRHLGSVRCLNLADNALTAVSVDHFTEPSGFEHLYSMAISDRGIGFEQRDLLAASPTLKTPEALGHGFMDAPLVYTKDCRRSDGAR